MNKKKRNELLTWFVNVVAVYDRHTTKDASVFYSDEFSHVAELILNPKVVTEYGEGHWE